MSSLSLRSWPDAGPKRWPWVVTVGPYVMLACLTAFTVVVKYSAGASLYVDLVLCALLALWTLWLFTLHPGWRDRTIPMTVFFTGVVVLSMVLVLRDPWFGFLAPAGYLYAFRVLPWPWLLLGVTAVAVVAGTAQAAGLETSTPLGVVELAAILAVNIGPMCGSGGRRGAPRNATRSATARSPNCTRPTSGSRRHWRRTPACTNDWWPARGRQECSTSGSAWRARSTTRWHRD